MLPIRAAIAVLSLHCAIALAAEPAAADARTKRLPLWELGIGTAVLRLPDYRGADQGANYLLPLPYVVYRGDWLRADREGARALLIETNRTEVDISVAAAVPSRNNSAREGMPELAPRVEVGPSANFELWRSPHRDAKLELRSPLRAAITVQRSPGVVGLSFTPNLNLDLNGIVGGWDLGLQAGLIYGNRRFHDYLYGVDAAYATVQRPVFAAPAGYAGWQSLVGTSRRFGNTWVGAFVRYDSLRGSRIAASPLVRTQDNLSLGIGVSWVFAVSDQLVEAER